MSGDGIVVSNSSPLIALDRIGRLELLNRLLGEVLVPPAVAREVFLDRELPGWIRIKPLTRSPEIFMSPTLGAGEREAIALAVELGASRVILDDLPARRLAATLRLPVIGTVGLILAAKRAGHVPLIASILDELLTAGFRLSPSVVAAALASAGEGR